jgi:hypothetical protein
MVQLSRFASILRRTWLKAALQVARFGVAIPVVLRWMSSGWQGRRGMGIF